MVKLAEQLGPIFLKKKGLKPGKKVPEPIRAEYYQRQGLSVPARKTTTKTKKTKAATTRNSRPTLPGALHSCAGLPEDTCDIAPNCYWQPNKKQCKTRSGKAAVNLMKNPNRDALMKQIKGQKGGRGGSECTIS